MLQKIIIRNATETKITVIIKAITPKTINMPNILFQFIFYFIK